ncbi:Eco57I restriction-modification methylase domain-containing protein [Enterococcus faecalis]
MAKTITQRSLAGYKGWDTNILFIPDLVKKIRNNIDDVERDVQKGFKVMKFDAVVGNPPYHENQENNNKGAAIYHYFYDLAEKVSERYVLISPARFLFNGGLTPKPWNKKMLQDKHLSVMYFTQNSADVFPNTEIKGGVSILYRDENKDFGKIGDFVADPTLRGISRKIGTIQHSLSDIVFGGRSDLKFTDTFLNDHPESIQMRIDQIQIKYPNVTMLNPNEEYELKSSTFESLDPLFDRKEPQDSVNYYKLLGLYKTNRTFRWINKKYMQPRYPNNNNVEKYKVFVPESNGSGVLGEALSSPLVGVPGMSSTPTFISLGNFDTHLEADNALKYIKTRFTRTLLGILKITQHNPKSTWRKIPMQDFTNCSDID